MYSCLRSCSSLYIKGLVFLYLFDLCFQEHSKEFSNVQFIIVQIWYNCDDLWLTFRVCTYYM